MISLQQITSVSVIFKVGAGSRGNTMTKEREEKWGSKSLRVMATPITENL